MKIDFPFSFGQEVSIIGQIETNYVKCKRCEGKGSNSYQDFTCEWVTNQCSICNGQKVLPAKPSKLKWAVVETTKVDNYLVSEGSLFINYRWTKSFNNKKYNPDNTLSDYNSAIMECGKRNSPVKQSESYKTKVEY